MPSSFRPCLALLTAAFLLVPPSLAFDTPLSDQAVREAYFLGQRHDETFAAFLNKYTRFLPPPKSGPHIATVTFLTPFALLVQHSSRQSNYSAQQAALDHRAHAEVVAVSVEILLTQSYGALIVEPKNSRSGSPLGYRFRSSGFWRDFDIQVFAGEKSLNIDTLTGEPNYLCGYEGGCTLTGATIHLQFSAELFASDSATVRVFPPEGDPVSVDFDLIRLR